MSKKSRQKDPVGGSLEISRGVVHGDSLG